MTSTPSEHQKTTSHPTLYEQALCLVLQHQLASVSLIQRHLRIGYNRALQLIEEMAENKIISDRIENDGYRQILLNEEQCAAHLLKKQ